MSPSPTADVLRIASAYRRAKRALLNERMSTSHLAIALFEQDLDNNLEEIRERYNSRHWFDGLNEIGKVYLVPKSASPVEQNNVGRRKILGAKASSPQRLATRMYFAPAVTYAVLEVLWLEDFGVILDRLLLKCAIGNRLNVRGKALHPLHVYKYWPSAFDNFLSSTIDQLVAAVERNQAAAVMLGDYSGFYDNVDPRFLLDLAERFDDPEHFVEATSSLLLAIETFRKQASELVQSYPQTKGIPTGAISSPLIANLALREVDRKILDHPNVIKYYRYVDDFAVICPTDFDATQLFQNGFNLNTSKTQQIEVHGDAGLQEIEAVKQAMSSARSQRSAFLTNDFNLDDLTGDLVTKRRVVRGLRDLDALRLDKYELTTRISEVERACRLLDEGAAEMGKALLTLDTFVGHAEDWLEFVEHHFRLLQITIRYNVQEAIYVFLNLSERIEALLSSEIQHSGNEVTANGKKSLSEYFRMRLRSVLMLNGSNSLAGLKAWNPILILGAKVPWTELNREMSLIKAAGLQEVSANGNRSRADREATEKRSLNSQAVEAALRTLPESSLLLRFCRLTAKELGKQTPLDLFLSKRGPSTADLTRWTLENFTGEESIELINFLRGTSYSIHLFDRSETEITIGGGYWHTNPIVVVANVNASSERCDAFHRNGVLPPTTLTLIDELKSALNSAREAKIAGSKSPDRYSTVPDNDIFPETETTEIPVILVLPELFLPRHWVSEIANFARKERINVVTGLEYAKVGEHHENAALLLMTLAPYFVLCVPWRKSYPAAIESKLNFKPGATQWCVHTDAFSFSTLICSQLLEVPLKTALAGKVQLIFVLAWNKDLSTFDFTLKSAAMDIHTYVALANRREYSDSRIWAPFHDNTQRDVARIVEREQPGVVRAMIKAQELKRFHQGVSDDKLKFKPLPPGWRKQTRKKD